MTELEEVYARFEKLNDYLKANPDIDRWEALKIIDDMRKCVDEKDALKESEHIASESHRKRRILEEEITQALYEFFGEEISDEDVEALAEKLSDVCIASGEGYEQ